MNICIKQLRRDNRGDKILYTHKNQKAYSKNVSGSNMMISKNMRVYDGANSGQQKQIDDNSKRTNAPYTYGRIHDTLESHYTRGIRLTKHSRRERLVGKLPN